MKSLERVWSSYIYCVPSVAKRDNDSGCSNVSASTRVASFALSADDVVGMVRLWGKNLTVGATRSVLVLVI